MPLEPVLDRNSCDILLVMRLDLLEPALDTHEGQCLREPNWQSNTGRLLPLVFDGRACLRHSNRPAWRTRRRPERGRGFTTDLCKNLIRDVATRRGRFTGKALTLTEWWLPALQELLLFLGESLSH